MMFRLLLITALFQISNSQQIIPLNKLLGGNVDNKINAVPPFSLYASAQADSSEMLRKIYVKTENNQIKSLYDLTYINYNGPLQPMKIQSQAYVSSALTNSQMAALDGFIYVTSTKQGNDANFKVFQADYPDFSTSGGTPISTHSLECYPCTLVILNTSGDMNRNSIFSSWNQGLDAVVKMYKGVPPDSDEPKNTQIFSNPVQIVNMGEVFIPSVEKFGVRLGAFYMKTTKYVSFQFKLGFFDLDGYVTTDYQTTGFYMKYRSQSPENVTVVSLRDINYNGTTGVNTVGNLPNPNGDVKFTKNEYYKDNSASTWTTIRPEEVIKEWSVHRIGRNLTISPENSEDGEFFVQYYFLQERVAVTPRPIEPTTGGKNAMGCMVGTIFMVMASYIL